MIPMPSKPEKVGLLLHFQSVALVEDRHKTFVQVQIREGKCDALVG